MANLYSQRTYDAALLLSAAATVATATTTTGSLIVNAGAGLFDADLIIDVTAMDVASTDESYNFILEGSPDATFGTAGNIAALAQICIGSVAGIATATGSLQGADDTVGRYLVCARNERNGTLYPYLRLVMISAGTTPSITYMAFLAKDDD